MDDVSMIHQALSQDGGYKAESSSGKMLHYQKVQVIITADKDHSSVSSLVAFRQYWCESKPKIGHVITDHSTSSLAIVCTPRVGLGHNPCWRQVCSYCLEW